MRDDTVTASPRAPLKDSSPRQEPPPPHAQPTVWGWGWGGRWGGRLCLISISKAAPLSIIRGCVPSSLRAGQCVERLRMTSPSPGVCVESAWREKATQRELDFYILYFSISLIAFAAEKKKKKNPPPRCLFTIKQRLRSDSRPGRRSCVE